MWPALGIWLLLKSFRPLWLWMTSRWWIGINWLFLEMVHFLYRPHLLSLVLYGVQIFKMNCYQFKEESDILQNIFFKYVSTSNFSFIFLLESKMFRCFKISFDFWISFVVWTLWVLNEPIFLGFICFFSWSHMIRKYFSDEEIAERSQLIRSGEEKDSKDISKTGKFATSPTTSSRKISTSSSKRFEYVSGTIFRFPVFLLLIFLGSRCRNFLI